MAIASRKAIAATDERTRVQDNQGTSQDDPQTQLCDHSASFANQQSWKELQLGAALSFFNSLFSEK